MSITPFFHVYHKYVFIMANISKIKISGTSYNLKDENACKVVELTQAEYDDLPTSAKTSNSLFVITDATAGDLSNYYTKTETDNAITAATSTKQDTLVSGTNIKTINGETLLGEGNIEIQGGSGGGKAIEAGRGISITTGETADTVSLNEAISASTASSSTYIAIGSGANAVAGYNAFLTNSGGIAIGSGATANRKDICIGNGANGYNINHSGLICIGLSSVSKQGGISIGNYSEAYGESGFDQYGGISIGFNSKTQSRNAIAIGYNTVASGTTKTNINNQIKVDDSNQIYIYNKDNTEMICLQDQLGGGSTSYTAGDGIDINNDVISVTGKVDTSTYNTYTAATDTALASKQTTLTAGTGISIVDNVISATGGGGGGSSINVVQTTGNSTDDVMSQDAVTTQLNGKGDAIGIDMVGSPKKKVTFQMRRGGVNGTVISSRDLTLGRGLVYGEEGFDTLSTSGLVETSAITTSISSSSTDSQVPSAKAVYDIVGNIETLLSKI